MRNISIIIVALGILITLFTGFNYITREKVVDIGELEISVDKNNSVAWSPLLGIALIIIGGGIYFYGDRKKS